MTFEEAVSKMLAPRQQRIIDIDITNKCDLACSNCTRLLANQEKLWEMSLENFRAACRSLKDYFGIIAIIGGNPCMHSKFPEICRIFEEEIPERLQRGIWTNNPFKHEELCKKTFGVFNLNAHGIKRAQPAIQRMTEHARSHGGIAWTYMGNSMHTPLLAAIKDVIPDKGQMWERISECEINKEWSATIIQNRGKLRAYFCEVAASFDLARGADHGLAVTPGWWKLRIQDFSGQIKHFCPGCGAATKQKGKQDCEEIDVYTKSNADIALKDKRRKTELLKPEVAEKRRVTQYGELV